MPGLCCAPGCDSSTTSRYSVYCSRHQSRLRRQGDVAQEAIRKADLKGYLKRVRQRIAKNPDNPAWGQLEARWLAVVEHAKAEVMLAEWGMWRAELNIGAAPSGVSSGGQRIRERTQKRILRQRPISKRRSRARNVPHGCLSVTPLPTTKLPAAHQSRRPIRSSRSFRS
jgi:hypothetical protein